MWGNYTACAITILNFQCDAIYRNQSEVEYVTFSVVYLIEVLIRRGTFCWKPNLRWTSGSKVIAIERF